MSLVHRPRRPNAPGSGRAAAPRIAAQSLVVAALILAASVAVAMAGLSYKPTHDHPLGGDAYDLAIADLGGDGRPDLAVPIYSTDQVAVLRGRRGGGFRSPHYYPVGDGPGGASDGPAGVTVGDLDGTRKPDLAVTNYSSGSVSVLLAKHDGGFKAPVNYVTGGGLSSHPYPVLDADLNRDGIRDLVTVNHGEDTISVFRGSPNGTFQAAQNETVGGVPYAAVVGLFNRDGRPDIAAVSDTDDAVSVLIGKPGGFNSAAQFSLPAGGSYEFMSSGDFDRDGHIDLAVDSFGAGGGVFLLFGRADGSFGAAQRRLMEDGAYESTVADLNRDHRADLAIADFDTGKAVVLKGRGNGRFRVPRRFAVAPNPEGIATGRLNGDKRPDIVTVDDANDVASVLLSH